MDTPLLSLSREAKSF